MQDAREEGLDLTQWGWWELPEDESVLRGIKRVWDVASRSSSSLLRAHPARGGGIGEMLWRCRVRGVGDELRTQRECKRVESSKRMRRGGGRDTSRTPSPPLPAGCGFYSLQVLDLFMTYHTNQSHGTLPGKISLFLGQYSNRASSSGAAKDRQPSSKTRGEPGRT